MLNLLYGSLLGDASIIRMKINKNKHTYRFEVGHNIKQKTYLEWKASYLNLDHCRIHQRISGYGSKMLYFRFYNKSITELIYKTCIIKKKKIITNDWIKHLDVLSLAVWYQDDGSWGHCGSKNKSGLYHQRYSTFSTCNFSLKSIQLLCKWLQTFDLKPRIKKHKNKYWIIILGQASTIKLWNIIAPYLVLQHKIDFTMRNKWITCKYCNKFIDYRNKVKICNWCIISSPIIAKQISGQALHARLGTTSIKKLSKVKLKSYKEPKVNWFDHSKFGINVQV